MVVSGDGSRYFYAQGLRLGSDFCNIKDVDSCSLVGRLVNEKVRVIVLANGYWDDLHGSIRGGREMTQPGREHGCCRLGTGIVNFRFLSQHHQNIRGSK
jgi:hypothetical protein